MRVDWDFFELFRYTKFAPQDFFMQIPGCNLVLSLGGAEATQRVLASFDLARYRFQKAQSISVDPLILGRGCSNPATPLPRIAIEEN